MIAQCGSGCTTSSDRDVLGGLGGAETLRADCSLTSCIDSKHLVTPMIVWGSFSGGRSSYLCAGGVPRAGILRAFRGEGPRSCDLSEKALA